ncbi:amino acid transporter protein [Methylobacterium sp. P1-11]|uniref:amino acid transporter protein n=1 Tax=Methylobacterium sp. P1-11 TaxID=2024616 RepID=UPI0011EF4D76|nr:amino acid transporter protein [Methylobacterium sp. P1-11]KAA0124499.1 amino acid transporter protein [Methylobacterium sp. P1-11]
MSGADADLRGKLVGNERAKLTATYINGLAIAVFAVGGFAPFIAALGVATEQHGFLAGALLLLGVCSLTSGALHWVARSRLGSLDP